MICASQYTEQVIISKDLTLKGLNSSTADGGTGAIWLGSEPQIARGVCGIALSTVTRDAKNGAQSEAQ
jgi:hypothetical protein